MSQLQLIPLLRGYAGSSGTQNSHKERWLVIGTEDRIVAQNAALAETEEYLAMLNGQLLPRNTVEYEQLGEEVYVITVNWGTEQNKDNKDPVFQFDTGGGTVRITQSIETKNSYRSSGTWGGNPFTGGGDDVAPAPIPNYKGAISVTEDGSVEGVELPAPVYNFSEKHYLSASVVTPSWRANLTLLKTRTNQAQFRGFDIDQVQFLGAKGSKTGSDLWEITFDFAAGPHVDDITIGDVTGISKKAWEYLWVKYTKISEGGHLITVPQYVYVEQVFYQADFKLLRIPQGPII